MKKYLLALIILVTSCVSPEKDNVQLKSQTSDVGIRSFEFEFREFFEKSENATVEEAWMNWVNLIEFKDQAFFREVVAGSNDDPDWEMKYRKSFEHTLPILMRYGKEIQKEFAAFPGLFEENLKIFKKTFPDFDLTGVPVYAVPSLLRFNGQGSEATGRPMLAFGIDTIVFLRNEPHFVPRLSATSNSKVLYAHEMFHVYHGKKQGIGKEIVTSQGQIVNDAWNEGLATYVSGIMNPKATEGDLLMDSKLSEVCRIEGHSLLKKFKSVAFIKRETEEGKKIYRDWFLLSSKDQSIPARAGYCVGLLIARRAAKAGVSHQEMVSWRFEDVPERVRKFIL